jgi:hypothetical protein
LKHDISCERFWSPILKATGTSSHLLLTSVIGLANPTQLTFSTLAIAFHYYHACRGQHYSSSPSLLETSVRAIILTRSFAPLQVALSSSVQELE